MAGTEVMDGLIRGAMLARMEITEKIVNERMDKWKLFDLLVYKGLPISQAVAVHLVDDMKYRPSDAARILGVSPMALSDAYRKGHLKLDRGYDDTKV